MAFAKKSLGQNFLMHAQTAERIVEAANLPEEALVLEIGPGTGMLTKALLERGYKVMAVEADDELAPALNDSFKKEITEGKLEVMHADIRSFDPISLGNTYHIVANIPYYLTGEILRTFLSGSHKPKSMTVLVQKEVAERIARNKGKESILSLSIKAFGEPKYCFTVPRGAFSPAPSIDSAVLSIQDIQSNAFGSQKYEDSFFSLIKAGFAHKRKRLAKNLEVIVAPQEILKAMEVIELDPNVRSEDVALEKWKELSKILSEKMP